MKEKITKNDVSNWVGNHGDYETRDNWMLETLRDIANGKYSPEELFDEISEYNS